MYMYAWKKGVKTTYYLRSRPATKIAKTTVKSSGSNLANTASTATTLNASSAAATADATPKKVYSDAEVIACSLENPEACEACQ